MSGGMKKLIPFIMLTSAVVLANPVRADITSRFASSVQLSVGGAHTTAERIGSSYAISGSNIDTTDGTTVNTVSTGAIASGVYSPGTIAATQDTPGAAFSFSQSYTQADAVPNSAVTVGASQNFGDISSTASGTTGDLAGQVTSAHTFASVAAGGANTSATTQFVTELTIK
ncbi:hypothetical protein PSSM7_172 [Prochlorococcus phage P-SSM7]|uniref:OMP1 protein n=1 Tax=Prochlorococcus phage P-SSM7 TaxID=445688 RepID=E3SNT6_9CAUD|nr:hypothetical protein PSSM7_172 [Prochlorococcus phage P-SSM7]ADO98935.1 hypothetical protein PSSM7_172 [Prochlorococcus phage P-SSM7]